ncbi:MAG: hypothetical protein AWM53_00076 [Candidatus Dichloromethanomonas elyunquensis]|nr:MAG: hypothetical protein AWM53_00076 [Candidatus Dichloromethanomonas elyunquensis]
MPEDENLTQTDVQKAIKSLQKQGFEIVYVEDQAQALSELLSSVPVNARVGIGGSATIRELGLVDILISKGHIVYDHWQEGLSPEKKLEMQKHHLSSDVFITGTNAITIKGQLVNTDHTGNRVAAMICGPEKVIVVAGVNKIVPDLHAAVRRIKEVAAPENCFRRKDPTPCAITKKCHDCSAKVRLCRVTTIIDAPSRAIKEFKIILIGKSMGY